MTDVYVVGSGAVGMALAAYLVAEGRPAVAVRTINRQAAAERIEVAIQNGADRLSVTVDSIGLSRLAKLDGIVAVAAKSYANGDLAAELAQKDVRGPLVVMQNGVGVEKPLLDALSCDLYRCVLYLTGQKTADRELRFRAIRPSSIGVVRGSEAGLGGVVAALSTSRFPFRAERLIQREIWKKAIINAVFNSICPLLDTDNGVFARDRAVARLAEDVVVECLALTDRLELGLTRDELMEQITQISRSSDGQLISTLQDIRGGRETEIESLNMEIARTAAAQRPRIDLPRTELLGRMTLARAGLTAPPRAPTAGSPTPACS